MTLRCDVLAVGTELLLGQIIDSNSAWIGGELAANGIDSLVQVKVGERLQLVPGHVDPTFNLYDWVVAVRDGRVESVWPVEARGAVG